MIDFFSINGWIDVYCDYGSIVIEDGSREEKIILENKKDVEKVIKALEKLKGKLR